MGQCSVEDAIPTGQHYSCKSGQLHMQRRPDLLMVAGNSMMVVRARIMAEFKLTLEKFSLLKE